MSREERAAMVAVCTALGRHLDLSAAEPSSLRVIAVGNDFHALDRVFRRRNDSRAAPHRAGSADAVNRNAIVFILAAMSESLGTVFCAENSVGTPSGAGALGARNVYAAAAAALCSITEHSRRQLNQLENVSAE